MRRALGLALLLCGCATNLSTLQTARTLDPGQTQVTLGVGAHLPVSQLWDVVSQGKDIGKRALDGQQPTDAERQALLTAAAALASQPPSVSYDLSLRHGFAQDFEAGVRYGGSSLRVDGKWRVLHRDRADGGAADVALGLGLARQLFNGPLFDALEIVRMGDLSRWDVEVPLYASTDFGDVLRFYAAPKYVFSHTSFDARLVDASKQGAPLSGADTQLPAAVNAHFVGSTFGLSAGFRYVFVFAELTSGYTWCRPLLFGERRNLGGVTFYPALGAALRW